MMEFFAGFRWAVPLAFSDAVAQCRFEEGDILYDTAQAYDQDWEAASRNIERSLQVRFPVRAAGGAATAESDVFARNWKSEVRIELYRRLKKVGIGQITTTQGRLYTALWKGDIGVLETNAIEPQIPIGVQQVTRSLGEASLVAREFAGNRPVFVMVRDLSNAISKEKYSKILSKLTGHLANDPHVIGAKAAGIVDAARVAPTVEIVFFASNGLSAAQLHDLIKAAVYVPAKDSVREKFRISAHGAIF